MRNGLNYIYIKHMYGSKSAASLWFLFIFSVAADETGSGR